MNPNDRRILRELAERYLAVCHSPENRERIRLWYKHHQLQGERPMVLIESRVAYEELFGAATDADLQCTDEATRPIERRLRMSIWQFEQVRDDTVFEPYVDIPWKVQVGNYGVEIKMTHGDAGAEMGSYIWEPPIKNIARDFEKLRPRQFFVDRTDTLAVKRELQEALGNLLPVRIHGAYWWSMGVTWAAIELIGLENLMLFMYDDPEGLHRLMGFLRDDHLAFARWLQGERLLSLNNENDYIGSGSTGYTHDLPAEGYQLSEPVRTKDMWVLLESQETVGVGPEQFGEFVLPYEISIAREFGRVYYGCCEPVHTRWCLLKTMPNLKAVSISPWCNQEIMAEQLGRDFVFSRKPSPTLISTEAFDERAIRDDLRHTLTVARNCEVELIMKDLHHLCGQPMRVARWVELARETIDELAC